MADRGHRVLQHALAAHVHVHVACRQGNELQRIREGEQGAQAGLVVPVAMQFHREVRAVPEHAAQPPALLGIRLRGRAPQREQPGVGIRQHGFHVAAREQVAAFRRGAACVGDELAQLRVAGRVLDQQHAFEPAGEDEFAADDQLHARGTRGLQPAHDPGQRAFVGDRQRFVAAAPCAFEQFLRTRGAAQEREVREAVQFRVGGQVVVARRIVVGGGQAPAPGDVPCARHAPARGLPVHAIDRIVPAHANQPCSIQPSRSPGGAKAHARCPCEVSST